MKDHLQHRQAATISDSRLPAWKRSKLYGVTEDGGHWYRKSDGSTFLMTKEEMKEQEDLHIRPEHGMPGYDPFWEYRWAKQGEELQQRAWFESLSDEEKDELKKRVASI